MSIWKVAKPGCNFYGQHIPAGSVYGILSEIIGHDKRKCKLCVYVTDLKLCRKNKHFVVYTMREGCAPVCKYVDGCKGWAKSIQAAVREMADAGLNMTVKPMVMKRDLIGFIPRDRMVGNYMHKAKIYPGRTKDEEPYLAGEAPDVMVDNYVTNGCKVGKVFLVEEGYCSKMYGMDAPDYTREKQA